MLNKALSFVLAGLFVMGIAILPAQAQTPETQIRQMLEQRDREIKRILGNRTTFTDEQREQLQTLINDDIDFEAMGRQALGTFWTDLTPAQRTSFVEVFSDIVRTQSLADLEVYKARVTYDTITVNGTTAHVVTTTTYKDTPTKVEYHMTRAADGTWDVDDIIVGDVSTAGGYEKSFQTVLRKKGFDALMTSLDKKRAQMQAKSS